MTLLDLASCLAFSPLEFSIHYRPTPQSIFQAIRA